jgi:hypothetical protein
LTSIDAAIKIAASSALFFWAGGLFSYEYWRAQADAPLPQTADFSGLTPER